jgi:hypothetical protein
LGQWLKLYQPFHWFLEFHHIMDDGGFDVILGNPPYLDLRQLQTYSPRNYATLPTRNLFSLILERCDTLSKGRQDTLSRSQRHRLKDIQHCKTFFCNENFISFPLTIGQLTCLTASIRTRYQSLFSAQRFLSSIFNPPDVSVDLQANSFERRMVYQLRYPESAMHHSKAVKADYR